MNKKDVLTTPIIVLLCGGISLLSFGCGSVEESTESTSTWAQPSQPLSDARLEYRLDSLAGENRRLKQQLDAVMRESRNLGTRNSELEMKLSEAMKQNTPKPAVNMNSAYEAALTQYKQKNFSAAAAQFESILASSKGFELADNCHYWAGECYYGMARYQDAMDHFEGVFNYVHAKKKADAQFMIGNCQLRMGNKAGAIASFNRVVNNYPTSDLVKRAQEKISGMK